MTVAVAFHQMEAADFEKAWEYALSHFQVDQLYCVGGPPPSGSSVLREAVEIAGSGDVPQDLTLVLLAPTNGLNMQGTESLATFVHPLNAVYWFGSDSRHLEAELFGARAPDHKVYVPVDTIDQMFSAAVWQVVAWDRRQKA